MGKPKTIHHQTRRLNEAEFDKRFPECPPALRALIKTNNWVIRALGKKTGVTSGAIRRVASGEEVKPATAKKLGLKPEAVDEKPDERPATDAGAEFDKKYPKCPKLVRDILERADWNFTAAARNSRSSYDNLKIIAETGKLTDRVKRRLDLVITGQLVSLSGSAGGGSTVIIIFRATTFEKLYDIAQHLGGQWSYKKHLGSSWLAVLKMPGRDLEAYVAMVKSYDAEVIPV